MSIVTISRGSLSGGASLAAHLGEALAYKVLSREVIVEAAKTYGVTESTLAEGMEHAPGLWARFTGHAEDYVLAVQATLGEMVEGGHAIYHGLAGQFLLKGLPGVLKIRLIAPLEQRITAACEELRLNREEAIAHIQKVDRERERWVRKLYDADWADPANYDLVINLGEISMDSAVDTIVQLLDRPEFRQTAEVQQAWHDFALAARIRAHLRFRCPLAVKDVHVAVRDGEVSLGDGPEADRDALIRFVSAVPGVRKIASVGEVVARPDGVPPELPAGEVMTPLDRYPHVYEWVPIRAAIVALSASAVRLEDDYLISPRYVLVLDKDGSLVGVVSRRDLLRGITPGYRSLQNALAKAEGVLPLNNQIQLTIGWASLFSPAAIDAAREPVRSIMLPVKGFVNADDPLSVVVSTMVQAGVDLVPVLDGQRVAGVVLMTDIFDLVAQHVMERGGVRPVHPKP